LVHEQISTKKWTLTKQGIRKEGSKKKTSEIQGQAESKGMGY
jgi:hypothetical protein